MAPKSFGQMIRQARLARGFNQKDLAAKLRKSDGESISPQYLNDIEHDRRNPPSSDIVQQLARRLDLNEDRLMVAANRFPDDIRELGLKKPEILEQVFREFRRRQR
jgi:transcriptional regulator with XRE-family HTH domain